LKINISNKNTLELIKENLLLARENKDRTLIKLLSTILNKCDPLNPDNFNVQKVIEEIMDTNDTILAEADTYDHYGDIIHMAWENEVLNSYLPPELDDEDLYAYFTHYIEKFDVPECINVFMKQITRSLRANDFRYDGQLLLKFAREYYNGTNSITRIQNDAKN